MTTVESRRRGRPGHDLESVLATAVGLFTRQGYDGTSVDDVARALGVGKSALYHHVDSKQTLLALALDRALDGLERAVRDTRRLAGTDRDRLEALLRRSVAVLVERLPEVTLLLRVRGNSPVEQAALVRRRRVDRYAAGLVAGAVAAGDLRSDVDPRVAARLAFGAVNSLVEWVSPGADPDALADAVVGFESYSPIIDPHKCP